jgi:hypothetical protein
MGGTADHRRLSVDDALAPRADLSVSGELIGPRGDIRGNRRAGAVVLKVVAGQASGCALVANTSAA